MSYTEDQKAVALAALEANRGNVQKTSKFTGIPQTTLRQWRDGEHISEAVTQKRDIKKANLADLYEQVTRDILGSITRDDISDAKLSERMTGAAIATDKMQLLREKPTNINAQYDSREARIGRITELLNGPGNRGTAVPVGTGEPAEQPTVQ